MPLMLGAVICSMFQILSDGEAHEKVASDVNQALGRTAAQYRLNAIA